MARPIRPASLQGQTLYRACIGENYLGDDCRLPQVFNAGRIQPDRRG